MKKEIVFIDDETMTKEEIQNMNNREQFNIRMKMYFEKLEQMNE